MTERVARVARRDAVRRRAVARRMRMRARMDLVARSARRRRPHLTRMRRL
jgi:hypothetical protein